MEKQANKQQGFQRENRLDVTTIYELKWYACLFGLPLAAMKEEEEKQSNEGSTWPEADAGVIFR